MRKLVLATLFALTMTGLVFAGTITPDLAAKMSSSSDNELIQILVTMKDQGKVDEMASSTASLDKQSAREAIVKYLKDLASASQIDVKKYIETQKRAGKIRDFQPFFIVNGFGLKAAPSVIHKLESMAAVDKIIYDPDRFMLLGERATGAQTENLNGGGASKSTAGADEIAWGVSDVHAPEVWQQGYNGTGVLVGMIDTGINYNHVDLADHMWNGGTQYPHHGYDFFNNDNDPMDDGSGTSGGHGTHTAGTVASDGTAGSQCGVAPNATIMAIKVLSGDGYGNESACISGINFAVAQGCDVFSMSLGWQSTTQMEQFRTACNNALAAGVVGAVAAGNEGATQYFYPIPGNVRTPGDVPPPWHAPDQTLAGGQSCVITVGATDASHSIANFSSVGPVTWQSVSPFNDYAYNPGMGLIKPDVSAPGVNIKSCYFLNNNGYVDGWSGTSMATPHVAGTIALMLSKNHNLTPRQVDSLLETTALGLGAPGKDNTYGAGLINALAAVNATPTGAAPSVNVTLAPVNPPITIPANGGSFNFNASVVNSGPQTSFSLWCKIKNPNGTWTDPVMGPVNINPQVNVTVTRLRTQNVPGTWPAGVYTYVGYAAMSYPSPAILDSSFFTFTKSQVSSGDPMVFSTENTGEPWDEVAATETPAKTESALVNLADAMPNPFNPVTTISFTLTQAAQVSLKVFDLQGRLVTTLVEGMQEAGTHTATFDGSKLASGIYLYRLDTPGFSRTMKMTLVK